MADKIKYPVKGLYSQKQSEAELACYQGCQKGNTCTFHGISAALRLLIGFELDPQQLSDEIDFLWWRFKPMRTFPGWAVTPRQQVKIIRYVSKKFALPIEAHFIHATLNTLFAQLNLAETTSLVTLLWGFNQAPPIYYADNTFNYNASKSPGGHTMLLAAFDPMHHLIDGTLTPWGFVNPWVNDAKHLFWMENKDFIKSWRFYLPFIGPNPLVIIHAME